MAAKTKPWTRDELARLPNDGNRYEVLYGRLLVTPQAGPWHQEVAAKLAALLRRYSARHHLGTVVGPGAVVFRKNELQPDVQVIPITGRFSRDAKWENLPTPLLVVEVLSPGSHRHDLVKKRPAYMRVGIPEYWVVDHEERRVLVFTPGSAEARIEASILKWRPKTHLAPFSIDLLDLLA